MGAAGVESAPEVVRGLGDLLVSRGVLTPQALADTIRARRNDDVPLDRRLLSSGAVTRRELLSVLDGAWDASAVDLMTNPPDPELMKRIAHSLMLSERWVPHHLESDGSIVVASAEIPDAARAARIKELLGPIDDVPAVHFVVTTDWDITQALLGALPSELVAQAAEALSAARPDLSAERGWVPWQRNAVILAGIVLFLSLAVSLHATLLLLLTAVNAMFFVGVAFKVVVSVVGICKVGRIEHQKRTADRQPEARLPDEQLPMFTILVPVYHEAEVLTDVVEHLERARLPRRQAPSPRAPRA